jgi:hypothetical protein
LVSLRRDLEGDKLEFGADAVLGELFTEAFFQDCDGSVIADCDVSGVALV